MPGCLIHALERLIRQKELNGILERTFPATGTAFARAVLADLSIELDVSGLENIPSSGRFIFASNHPLGGLDGIALIAVLGQKYGDDGFRFPVNDMLMNVRPLRSVFLPINKFGKQGREASQLLNEAYESDMQILMFPAGLVSRKLKRGLIADLQWQKAFVAKALEYKRDIIPVHFIGENSSRFYNTARWRKRLHIGFNFEQILLPSELCKAQGKRFKIVVGTPIPYASLAADTRKPLEIAASIREAVYKL